MERIHADLFGLIVDVSVKGNRFGLKITDDTSASKFLYGLKSKDQAIRAMEDVIGVPSAHPSEWRHCLQDREIKEAVCGS